MATRGSSKKLVDKADADVKRLTQFEPEEIALEGSWQQRTSAQTRIAVLEAAIDCLAEFGYSRTTTQLIAKRAEISRGAMLHHYATKQDLVASLIDYVIFKRLQGFMARIAALSEDARVRRQAGIELYWQSLLTPEFTAYLELSLAARTDAELRAIWLPRARRYDRLEREEVLKGFPEWAVRPDEYKLAMDYCIASMSGLLLNREIWSESARRRLLREFVSRNIRMLREGELQIPTVAED